MAQPGNHDLAQRMAELARASAAPRNLTDVLSDVTSTALELIPGVDTAGVLLIGSRGKFESLANTSDLPCQLDELQMTYNEGPCVQAALDDVIVRTDDFREERRWPAVLGRMRGDRSTERVVAQAVHQRSDGRCAEPICFQGQRV